MSRPDPFLADADGVTPSVDLFAADVADWLAANPPEAGPVRPTPRHPATGCPCTTCRQRDDHLEDIAEERAYWQRHGDY